MRDDPTRRNVMATGASDAEDWPEFAEWLSIAADFDRSHKAFAAAVKGMSRPEVEAYLARPEVKQDGVAIDALLERYFELIDAITKKPIETERQLAMATAVWIYDHERNLRGSQNFDLTDYRTECGEVFTERFVLAAARRANALLPEVPFIFPVEG